MSFEPGKSLIPAAITKLIVKVDIAITKMDINIGTCPPNVDIIALFGTFSRITTCIKKSENFYPQPIGNILQRDR